MASGGTAIQRMPTLPQGLPLDFLKKITNDFTSEEIGKGAFGTFYKGTLEDGANISVMKLLENSPVPPDQIFEKEVQNIMVLEHENIAKLVAYCREPHNKLVKYNDRYIIAEITETILCYEYLPQGSLDKHIFGETSSMDWNTRFKIIKGITKGIHFLHNLPKPILHLGLSPSNIWLDHNMVPKIADFGFSRIFGQGQTRKNTQSQVGTVGYMAPEYLYQGEISARSDIYSLGLIIMEIATKEKNSSSKGQKDARNYIEAVKENWTLEKIMSEHHELDGDGPAQVETCINIALRCVEIDQDKRPRINEIVNELN